MDFGDRLVRFIDPRRFGALDVVDAALLHTHKLLAVLGQEPLEAGFDGAFLHRVSRARKVAVKVALKAKDFSSKFPTINVSKST
jgi:formamidopyrimidine-DNA glycosylase